jgi:hypothetical protein
MIVSMAFSHNSIGGNARDRSRLNGLFFLGGFEPPISGFLARCVAYYARGKKYPKHFTTPT